MSTLTREQADWLAMFLETDVETLLAGFEDTDGPAAQDGQTAADSPEDQTASDETDDQTAATTDASKTAPQSDDLTPEAKPADAETVSAAPGDSKVGIAPVAALPLLPVVIIAGVQYLTRELNAKVTITNKTDQILTLDKTGLQLPHGELNGAGPKKVLAAGEATKFTARSKSLLSFLGDIPLVGPLLQKFLDSLIGHPSLGGVEGTVRYLVGDSNTPWTCHFAYPRMVTSSKEADGTVGNPNPTNVKDASEGPPSGEDWSFELVGKGGGGGGGGQSAAAVTCRVTVNNNSDQPIFLRHQDNIAGEFITNPKPTLKPGESDNFMYGASANDKDRGCRGKLFYDVADPKIVEWELMWDNRVTQKNISASFLNPANNTSGLHSLDQIDNGDENVPATFTLSGKGGGQPPAQAGQFTITMDNKTDAELALTGSTATGGTLAPQPPPKLAAGASATLQFTPDPAAKGGSFAAIWEVGPSGSTWFTKGTFPASGDPTAEGTLNPASPTLSSTATVVKSGAGATLAYVISGQAGPADDKFLPPPKGKQPTLRKGDNTADGWVEYAQQQLNLYKLGPDLQVNGDFDGNMEQRVKAVQTQLKCTVIDGIIGNETWSALRAGPREAVGTDGRKPHTFEEKGAQARFFNEAPNDGGYDQASDRYYLTVVSTGEQPIDASSATMEVTQPNGTSHTHKVPIGKAYKKSPDGQGNLHAVEFRPFSQLFKLAAGITPDMCTIDTYLDGDIGGDRITIPPQAKPTP